MGTREESVIKGNIHSIETIGGLDGPGMRVVVFMQGCNLRCGYCHNPDTWEVGIGKNMSAEELVNKIKRYKPYIKKTGGVTFSGGEPLIQAEFLKTVIPLIKKEGLHVAIDTSGSVETKEAKEASLLADLMLLDLKMVSGKDYKKYIGFSLKKVLNYLKFLNDDKKEVIVRTVVIPGINDDAGSMSLLRELVSKYECVKKIELLPFKKICEHKYEEMGISFPFKEYEQMDEDKIKKLYKIIEE